MMSPTLGLSLPLILLSLFADCHSFEWTSSGSLPDQTTVAACPHSQVLLPWAYLSATGETVVNVEWRYEAYVAGSAEVVLATQVNGHFFADPSDGPQLEYMGTGASVRLPNAKMTDSGVYSVLVNLRHGGLIMTSRQSVHVIVMDASVLENSTFEAQVQGEQFMNSSQEYQLVLTCGPIPIAWSSQLGVVWTTPRNQTVSSTDQHNGQYSLAVPNPVQGGLYTCRVNNSSPAASCLQSDSPLLAGSSVQVDGVEARLMLMGKELKSVKSQVQDLQTVNDHLNDMMQEWAANSSHLAEQVQHLKSEVSRLERVAAACQKCHEQKPPIRGSCNFDVDLCEYTQSTEDDFDWTRSKGPTGSSDTGPTNDHTTGTSEGFYMYTEASSPRAQGDKAVLKSPPNNPSNENICLSFFYHMYGSSMGTLSVMISNATSVSAPLFSRSGDQRNMWHKASVTVPAKYLTAPFQIEFEGVVGSNIHSDMAIDDVTVTRGRCS